MVRGEDPSTVDHRRPPATMNSSGFDMRLGIESALRRALPYGGLPGNDSPQTAFFDAATGGDLRRLRGEQSPVAPTSQGSRRARPRGARSPRCGVAFARVLAGMGSAHARACFDM